MSSDIDGAPAAPSEGRGKKKKRRKIKKSFLPSGWLPWLSVVDCPEERIPHVEYQLHMDGRISQGGSECYLLTFS